MIFAHPLIDTRTPPLIWLSSCHIQLELTCVWLVCIRTSAPVAPQNITSHLPYLSPTFTIALNPPPYKVYDFLELAIDNINEFIKGQGYAVTKFRSKTDKQIPPTARKIWLGCAKSRVYINTSKTRFISSRIIGCPFKAILTRILIRWSLEVKDPNYNYAAIVHPTTLPQNCWRTYDTNKTIANMLGSSIRANKILTNLLKKDVIITI